MKCETTNTILTIVLGLLILLDVWFAVRTINETREFRSLEMQATQDQAVLQQLRLIDLNVRAFNEKNPNPELTHILQSVEAKPASK